MQPLEEIIYAVGMVFGNVFIIVFILAQMPPCAASTTSPANKGTLLALSPKSVSKFVYTPLTFVGHA